MAKRRATSVSSQRLSLSRKGNSRLGVWVRRLLWIAMEIAFVGALIVAVACAAYAYRITDQITERFEGKRWKVPSRVYSDLLTVLPGDSLGEIGLVPRLQRLSYQDTKAATLSPGEYRVTPEAIDVFLRDFLYPWERAKGYWLRIERQGGTVKRLLDVAQSRELPSAEIEPELIARFFGDHQEDRDLVAIEDVSPHLLNAIVSIEDKRFYHHFGFDPIGFTRAMLTNVVKMRMAQGGSTLTQQLVKNFYLSAEQTVTRKAKEAVMAFVLEQIYTKDAIFEAYLNEVYFAQEGSISVCGVGQASRFYFGEDVRTLGLADSALLAAMIRSPAGYNPSTRMEKAKGRRDYILKLMHENEMITTEQYQNALAEPVQVLKRKPGKTVAPYFIDFLRKELDQRYGPDILISEGLSIFTTLDVQTQRNAESALKDGLIQLEKDYPKLVGKGKDPVQGAIVVIQPQTGYIRAMVGGRNYYESQFNRATQAKRQVGSVFKPFVYAAGFQRAFEDRDFEFTPATIVIDEPFTLNIPGGKPWTPHNYEREYLGPVTVRKALEKSMNVPTVKLAVNVGIKRVRDTAQAMGIETPLEEYPSISLGAADLAPLEVASAYSTLANQGTHAEPLAVRDIVDAQGNVLEKKPVRIQRVLSPEAAYLTTSLLEGVINRGTGARARGLGFRHPAAGKTGTTNDYKDAWFVGYTPKTLAAVWVGFDDHARSINLAGSRAALPIWTRFMIEQVGKGPAVDFERPEDIIVRKIDPETGLIPVYDCPTIIDEVFLDGTEPTEECDLHKDSIIEIFKKNILPEKP
ncbi:MAG: PBP1A family penicillin-binding protein [Deltaproteobacteria bacterium]|nr:PBP1A family penicillin-binding protein [Deltaproteobacteria bacterium]MCB9488418.1 PBP1A family penicillin-binding protein [Deltaproteobacteria bacterium]